MIIRFINRPNTELKIAPRFDSDGDLIFWSIHNDTGQYVMTWIPREVVARIRDHLNNLLGDKNG